MNQKLCGFLLVDKPTGITSFDTIRHIQKIVRTEHYPKLKIAHMGALDPLATGLVILGLGKEYTRQAASFLLYDKQYAAEGLLGIQTDTGDITGEQIETCTYDFITKQHLQNALGGLSGSYVQTPPIYSALKYKGKPLYHYARKKLLSPEELQEIAKQKARAVEIKNLSLTAFDPPHFSIFAHVSHGTYIRSLIEAIAQKATSCATTTAIRRVTIGPYSVDDSVSLSQLRTIEDITVHLRHS